MSGELETILRLVAEGHLSPEEAAPIIDALTTGERQERSGRREGRREARIGRRIERAWDRAHRAVEHASHAAEAARGVDEGRGRQLRIRVTEHGRQVVNLRIPIAFADTALGFVPGIGGEQSERIRQAVAAGTIGPIVDVEDPDGDGVLISIE